MGVVSLEEVTMKAFLYDLNEVFHRYGLNWVEIKEEVLVVSSTSGATTWSFVFQTDKDRWEFELAESL